MTTTSTESADSQQSTYTDQHVGEPETMTQDSSAGSGVTALSATCQAIVPAQYIHVCHMA